MNERVERTVIAALMAAIVVILVVASRHGVRNEYRVEAVPATGQQY